MQDACHGSLCLFTALIQDSLIDIVLLVKGTAYFPKKKNTKFNVCL